jgi:hypothetical protein
VQMSELDELDEKVFVHIQVLRTYYVVLITYYVGPVLIALRTTYGSGRLPSCRSALSSWR